MTKIVIKAEELGKRYSLGTIGTGTLYRDLNIWWAQFRKKQNPYRTIDQVHERSNEKNFWALKDINFELREGEALGLIGRNGAGKSTLLKILSKITKPSVGQIKVCGRIAGLLEIGTGFHNELTGRENIFLNGAIMGLSRRDIRLQLDEIVSFAGVNEYIDTPVKRYSSGMYMRLGFAVAAHLNPDILIIDEVLAVGDAEFQRKCIGKMGEIKGSGRTLIFVSHNLSAVRNLCSRALLLNKGILLNEGSAEEMIQAYNETNQRNTDAHVVWDDTNAPCSRHVRLNGVRIIDVNNQENGTLTDNSDFFIEILFTAVSDDVYITPNIQLFDGNGTMVLSTGNWGSITTGTDPYSNKPYSLGQYKSLVRIPAFLLNEGWYRINVLINKDVSITEIFVNEVITFEVLDSGTMKKEYMDILGGVIKPRLEWITSKLPPSLRTTK